MKKKIALTVACLFLMSSAALAAPLTDYKAGKASIDMRYRSTKNTFDEVSFDRKFNLEPSVTYSVADKWAIQWRNVSSKSKSTRVGPLNITNTLTVNEFNVLYSLTPKVSAFAGYVSGKGTLENANAGKASDTQNTWQLGLLASVPLADKVAAYGIVGAGDKYVNYEIGLSYAFTKNWEFNVDYRNLKVKELEPFGSGISKGDFKAKGWGFGVTHKFN